MDRIKILANLAKMPKMHVSTASDGLRWGITGTAPSAGWRAGQYPNPQGNMETITIGLLTATGIGILMGFASAIFFVSTTAKQRWWDAYRQGYQDAKEGRK